MRRRFPWLLALSLALIAASAGTYAFHYLIFRDTHHIFIYMIGDIAFLFLDVLLVLIVIERLLARQQRKAAMNKLNMIIGAFFSEVGMDLFRKFSPFLDNAGTLDRELTISPKWTRKDFRRAAEEIRRFPFEFRIEKDRAGELMELRDFLVAKRPFLLRLLENPILLEHGRFTDILWAVFHLAEELGFRGTELRELPESDYRHMAGDMRRACSQMAGEWVVYTGYLQERYPFLFSLAARVNPFTAQPSAVVHGEWPAPGQDDR